MKRNNLFNINNHNDFEKVSLEVFQFQADKCLVYKEFLDYLRVDINEIKSINQIPYLPIQFFKSHKILSSQKSIERTFLSSGTTGSSQSKHYVTDLSICFA